MSVDAIAVLPLVTGLRGKTLEGSWKTGKGPRGGRGVWCELRDGILLNLGFPIETSDADLYEIARRWMGKLPDQVWVFPDTGVPRLETAQAIQVATREVGRWVKAGPRQRSRLEDLGFTPEEEEAFQREMSSGDANRVRNAIASMEKRLEGKDPAELQALLADILRRR